MIILSVQPPSAIGVKFGKVAVLTTVAELFARFGSATAEETVAELAKGPLVCGLATIVTVAKAPLARAPRLQVTTPATWVELPCDAVAETKLIFAGKASVKVTLVAVAGP